MSKICRTFAANLKKIMSKMKYIEPKMTVESVRLDAFVMLLESGSGPQPAPKRVEVAPSVPGEPL